VEGLDEDRGHAQPVLAGGGQVDEMIEIDAQVRDGGHRWFAEADAGRPLLLPGRSGDRRQGAAEGQLTGDGDELASGQAAAGNSGESTGSTGWGGILSNRAVAVEIPISRLSCSTTGAADMTSIIELVF